MLNEPTQHRIKQAEQDAEVATAFHAWYGGLDDKNVEKLDILWEAMWTACDFSWSGLSDAGWDRGNRSNHAQCLKRWRAPLSFPGGGRTHGEGETAWREASLQDYWRWSLGFNGDLEGKRLLTDKELQQAGLLRTGPDGRLWHFLHMRDVTVHDDEREEHKLINTHSSLDVDSSKFTNLINEFLVLITARLSKAPITVKKSINIPHDVETPDERLRLTGAREPNTIKYLQKYIHNNNGGRKILSITSSCANFHNLDLSNAKFNGIADFDHSRISGETNFKSSKFSNILDFSHSYFGNISDFHKVEFGEITVFSGCIFANWTRFHSSTFTGHVSYSGAQFNGPALFDKVIFADMASFDHVNFKKAALFNQTNFNGQARFEKASFSEKAEYHDAKFARAAWFDGAQFEGDVSFETAQFEQILNVENLYFREIPVRFHEAKFAKIANFSGTYFPNQPSRIQSAFKTAKFFGEANFETSNFTAFAAFDSTIFKGKVLLSAPDSDAEELTRYSSIIKVTKDAAESDAKVIASESYIRQKDQERFQRGTNTRFLALERGLRELKKVMANEKDHAQELRFFRFELQARRHRPSTSFLEKVASRAYGLLSDYGNSIGRPLSALVLSVLGFWVIYWIWGACLDQSFHGLEKERSALEFSIRNVVQPFGPWTATAKSTLFQLEMVKIVTCGGPPTEICSPTGPGWLLFRLLATLQSVFSLLLAFLFALALRKKFQIN